MLRKTIIVLCTFTALSAIAGAVQLMLHVATPAGLLAHTPFSSFLVPALLLGAVVGGSCVVAALLQWRHSRWAIDTLVFAGGALTVWILAETALLQQFSVLQLVYGAIGLTLLGIGGWSSLRSREPRQRWIAIVTVAEATGYMAPALTGIISTRLGATAQLQALLVVLAGFVEGALLGAGQAYAWPMRLRRRRYIALTSLAAAAVWGAVMAMMLVAGPWALALALPALFAIGGAQWIELRHHRVPARRWIGWAALAWLFALPLSFAPGPLVDETTPLAVHIVLWGCGGALIAYVMALITWRGVAETAQSGLG